MYRAHYFRNIYDLPAHVYFCFNGSKKEPKTDISVCTFLANFAATHFSVIFSTLFSLKTSEKRGMYFSTHFSGFLFSFVIKIRRNAWTSLEVEKLTFYLEKCVEKFAWRFLVQICLKMCTRFLSEFCSQ